jgi:hypothetical protein
VPETSSFSCPIEFFSTNVPVKSDALLVQLHHILLMLEKVNIHVQAICSDAGTGNSKFFWLLREQPCYDQLSFNINSRQTSFVHPFAEPERRVYMYHCIVHGMKVICHNIEKSKTYISETKCNQDKDSAYNGTISNTQLLVNQTH